MHNQPDAAGWENASERDAHTLSNDLAYTLYTLHNRPVPVSIDVVLSVLAATLVQEAVLSGVPRARLLGVLAEAYDKQPAP
jgi:hypothetical protein